MKPAHDPMPDLQLAAVCGLYCGACTLYIGTMEEPERLKKLADRFGQPLEKTRCRGCRSDTNSFYCETCVLKTCAAEKGVEFCGSCPQYPCETLCTFQGEKPHRRDLWTAQERIKQAGAQTWLAEMRERYACPQCGVINSAYDLACRSCGKEPGSSYVREHHAAILVHLK